MEPLVTAKGARSPRWAVLKRMHLRTPDGSTYLDRLRLLQTPWFGIYVHKIASPDPDPDPHDHPWWFGSFVLRGGYEEILHPIPHVWLEKREPWRYTRWTWHTMGRDKAHRITAVQPNTWTLVLVGKRRGSWGFHTADGFVRWQDYEKGTS